MKKACAGFLEKKEESTAVEMIDLPAGQDDQLCGGVVVVRRKKRGGGEIVYFGPNPPLVASLSKYCSPGRNEY